ncbi:hypothetical protein ACI6PO_06520 [Agrobacterium tumefaciens]
MSVINRGKVSGSSVEYEIEGTFDEVSAEVKAIYGRYPTPGYGTHFNWPPGSGNSYLAPKDLGNGRWIARGHRSTSCD